MLASILRYRLQQGLLILIAALLVACSGRSPATLPPSSTATDAPENQTIVITATPLPAPEWTIFTDGNEVRDLAFGPDGTLWAATVGGVVAWDVTEQSYTKYTTMDGLPSNQIGQLAVAPDGSLWFATESGVLRYDGQSWKTYTVSDGLLSNNVTSVAIAPDGVLWAGTIYDGEGTMGGLSHYDGQTWTSFSDDNGLDDGINAIAFAPDGTLWLASGIGLLHLDTGGMPIQLYSVADGLPSTSIFDLLFTPDGSLWIATDAGVVRYDGQNWQLYDTSIGLVHNQVFDIALAPDGRMWFATSGGITVYDGEKWQSYATGEFPEENVVFALAFAEDGSLYAGTGRGIVRMDEVNRQILRTNDPPVSDVLSLAIDKDWTLWVGTGNQGLLHYHNDVWERFTTLDGLMEDCIHSIAFAPDDSLWAASWHSVSHFDGQSWRTFPIGNEQVGNSFHPLAITPDGTIWMGTGRGLLRLEKDVWQLVSEPDLTVLSLFAMPDNTLWIGTATGIYSFAEGEISSFESLERMRDFSIWTLYVDPNNGLWAGTSDGLFYFEESWFQEESLYHGKYFEHVKVTGLAYGTFDRAIWSGSYGQGIARIVPNWGWDFFTLKDGLVNNKIQTMIGTPNGIIWIAGPGGLSRVQQ